MTDLSNYTELTDVNFEFEGAHIAVVHKEQGGAANGIHYALITKATNEISEDDLDNIIEKDFSRAKVEMRLDDFLAYFKELPEQEQEEAFYHYEQRAEGMVPVLNETFFEDRINDMDFMKSIKEISELTEEQKLKIKLFQSDFEKGLLSGNSPDEGEGDSKESINKSKDTQQGENNSMSEKDVKQETVDIEKAFAESPLYKSLKAEIDAFKAKEEARVQEELTKAVKGFEFVVEDKVEGLAGVLKALDSEKQDILLEVLAKANADIAEAKENAAMFVQKSASGEGEYKSSHEELSAKVMKALKGE